MPLTREFRETIAARVQMDSRFREALFTEALNSYLAGETGEGKAILRDLVNATVGFEALAAEVGVPSKSLHRMLGAGGNPSSEHLFEIVRALQKKTRVKLRVTARTAQKAAR
jgi:DNA-binding phage protein